MGVGAVVGVIFFIAGAAHGFRSTASLPLGLNKNYVGSVLGLSMLVALAAPRELELKPEFRYAAIAAMGGGLVASHSRAAMLALVVGIFVWFFRTHSDYRKRGFIIAAVLAAGFLTYASYLVSGEIANKQATQNTNSVAVRNKTEDATIALWRTSPVVGVGIYYYTDPAYQEINRFLVAPTNAVVEALAEGGIVLAAGFIIFNVGAVSVLLRYRNPLAVAGLACVADRLAHGMVDIFWTAGELVASVAHRGHGDGSGRGHGSHGDRRIRGAANACARRGLTACASPSSSRVPTDVRAWSASLGISPISWVRAMTRRSWGSPWKSPTSTRHGSWLSDRRGSFLPPLRSVALRKTPSTLLSPTSPSRSVPSARRGTSSGCRASIVRTWTAARDQPCPGRQAPAWSRHLLPRHRLILAMERRYFQCTPSGDPVHLGSRNIGSGDALRCHR